MVDSNAFHRSEPQRYADWKALFEHLSVGSFTAQKLYLINAVRRKYRLPLPPSPEGPHTADTNASKIDVAPKPAAKPMFKPKIK